MIRKSESPEHRARGSEGFGERAAGGFAEGDCARVAELRNKVLYWVLHVTPAAQPLTVLIAGTFLGWAAQQAGDTQVFVNIGPVNAFPFAEDFEILALGGSGVEKPGEPSQRDRYLAPVSEQHSQLVLTDRDLTSSRANFDD